MKKIVMLLIAFIIAAIAFTGCFKGDNLEENKIIAPEPSNLSIYGSWQITNEYKISANDKLEEVKNPKSVVINISKQSAVFGDVSIDNPNFKFKRVKEADYLPKDFDSVVNDVPSNDGYMDVVTIANNTNLYLDFIAKNNDEGYIYVLGDLVKVKRIDSNQSNVSQNSSHVANENETKNSGILLGMKVPAVIEDNKVVKSATYKTYWISMKDGEVQDYHEMEGLMLPRVNGTFSDIDVTDKNVSGKDMQSLNVVNYNKNGSKTVESSVVPIQENRQLTFAGKDYLGMQYYDPAKNDTQYAITTIGNINANKNLDVTSLFGATGEKQYENSRQRFVDSNPSFVINKYNLNTLSPSDITLVRRNGKWILESNIESDVAGINDISFDIPIAPVGTLVNYDSLPFNWNKIKQIDSKATDAFASPAGNLLIIIDKDSINLYKMSNGTVNPKILESIPINEGQTPVMAEWAVGDFTALWNKSVEERIN